MCKCLIHPGHIVTVQVMTPVLSCLSGLMRDDTIYENPDVKEAIRRLPERAYNNRMFRIKRALDLSMKQQILPKEQWTKFEEVKSRQLHLRNLLGWFLLSGHTKYLGNCETIFI